MSKDLSSASLQKFRERACQSAMRKGFNEQDAEEFAQEYLLMLQTKGWRQTVNQALVDFTRQRLGRPRVPGDAGDAGGKIVPIPMSDFDDAGGENALSRVATVDPRVGERVPRFEELVRGASERGRLIFFLLFKWGFTNADIGEILDVSESRVSQLYSQEVRAQKKRIETASAREGSREGQLSEQSALPRAIQERSEDQGAKAPQLASSHREEGHGLELGEIKEVSQAVPRPFRVNAF